MTADSRSAMPEAPPEAADDARMDDPASLVHFEPLSVLWLDTLLPIEEQAYVHPWSRGNFQDAMVAGNEIQLLVNAEHELLGYFVAMAVLDEVHLLNITVAPAHQGQGGARRLLQALDTWARSQQARELWLEVRASNTRALALYRRHGYVEVGVRKRYYALADGAREDAILMSLNLWP